VRDVDWVEMLRRRESWWEGEESEEMRFVEVNPSRAGSGGSSWDSEESCEGAEELAVG
jgi:hypothetical protein